MSMHGQLKDEKTDSGGMSEFMGVCLAFINGA